MPNVIINSAVTNQNDETIKTIRMLRSNVQENLSSTSDMMQMIKQVNDKLASCSTTMNSLKESSRELNADFADMSGAVDKIASDSRRASVASSVLSSRSGSMCSFSSACMSSSASSSDDEANTYVMVTKAVNGQLFETEANDSIKKRRVRQKDSDNDQACPTSFEDNYDTSDTEDQQNDAVGDALFSADTSLDKKLLNETKEQIDRLLQSSANVPTDSFSCL